MGPDEDFGFCENEVGSSAEEGGGVMGPHTCESLGRPGSVCNPMPSIQ